jgi:hypothetical protein
MSQEPVNHTFHRNETQHMIHVRFVTLFCEKSIDTSNEDYHNTVANYTVLNKGKMIILRLTLKSVGTASTCRRHKNDVKKKLEIGFANTSTQVHKLKRGTTFKLKVVTSCLIVKNIKPIFSLRV